MYGLLPADPWTMILFSDYMDYLSNKREAKDPTMEINKRSSGTTRLPEGADDKEFVGDSDVRPMQQGPGATAAPSLSMVPENRPHEQSHHESQHSLSEKLRNMTEKKTIYKIEVNNNMTTAACEEKEKEEVVFH